MALEMMMRHQHECDFWFWQITNIFLYFFLSLMIFSIDLLLLHAHDDRARYYPIWPPLDGGMFSGQDAAAIMRVLRSSELIRCCSLRRLSADRRWAERLQSFSCHLFIDPSSEHLNRENMYYGIARVSSCEPCSYPCISFHVAYRFVCNEKKKCLQ